MKGFGQIAFKIWLCAACAQAFVLLAFFNGLQEARLIEVQRQLRTMVSMVVDPASAKAALGFPLRYQSNLQKLLDDLTRTDTGVDLYIVDPDGVIIFSSDQVSIGTTAPAVWLRPRHARDAQWSADTTEESVAAAVIGKDLPQPMGTVVARSSRRNLVVDAFSALIFPAKASAFFLALMALLATGGVVLAVRPLGRYLEALGDGYRKAGTALSQGEAPAAPAASPGVEAAAGLLAELRQIEEAGVAVDRYAPKTDAA